MKCVIAGGSGFLGRALCKRLASKSHEVVILTRGAARNDGAVRYVTWPAVDEPGPWREEINGAGAIINLAGAGLADKRWTTNRKEELHSSRVLATRALVSAIRDAARRPQVLLSGSAIGFYGAQEDEGPQLDESGPPGSDFLATLCVDWEAEAHAAEALDCRVVMFRTGIVLSRDGGALQKLIPPFKLFVGGPLGSGRQVMSWIHLHDWVSLVSWLAEHPSATGAYNCTSPHPVTNAELSKALGIALGRPSWLRVPGFVLKIILGEMAGVALLKGQHVIPGRAVDAGFSFEYPTSPPPCSQQCDNPRTRAGRAGESTMRNRWRSLLVAGVCLGLTGVLLSALWPRDIEAQGGLTPAPARRTGEGAGPFNRMIIRNVMIIDGTGAPPYGPMNVIVSGNRIASIQGAGTPGVQIPAVPAAPAGRQGGAQPAAGGGRQGGAAQAADHVIDGTGMYLMPGFVDMHVHAGGAPKNQDAEYAYKLWLGSGVTTVRGVALGSNQFSASERARSEKNEIVAPRIFNYQRPGGGNSPEAARAWVRQNVNTIDGLKLGAMEPDVMAAVIEEAHKNGLGTTAHLQQSGVAQMNAMNAARVGLDTVTHFYGHFEALLKDNVVQAWPIDANANDEQWRFGQVARLWDQIHPQGSPEWKAYLQEHLKLGTTFDPTFTIYSASRDVMRARQADYHDKYTLPSLMDYYQPSRVNHGSYWYDWTTHDEIAWRNFYQVWFKLVNDYKKLGGRVTTGSDSGFIYQTYGFGYILELEMLQEAGFHPLEVIQAATMNGALTLSEWRAAPVEFGVVKAGRLADMILVDQNPLQNLKVLYPNGAVRLNDATGKAERVGGIKWTIKDGIAYDAKQLMADVAAMVEKQRAARK